MKTLLFPGSFDPFTRGHADIVRRALALADHIVIAVGVNADKHGHAATDERTAAIEHLFRDEPRVSTVAYHGLTTRLAQEIGADAILRGVRSVKDFEYERDMADVNRQLTGIETVLLFASPQYAAISSSVVRELKHYGEDVSQFLPENRPAY